MADDSNHVDATAEIAVAAREANQDPTAKVRTAVIIVHGMGEQLPVATLNQFVTAALPKLDKDGIENPAGQRHYFSRPERVTDSYEARRHLAYKQPPRDGADTTYGQTEFFEYHWSYMMTGNKLGDLLPTFRRLLLRWWTTVPFGIRGLWLLAWIILLTLVGAVIWVAIAVPPQEWTLAGVLVAVLGPGALVTLILQAINHAGNAITKSFVDVVRYLDRSPRSYEARREIRKGMADLLLRVHETGRYSRVVVVGHSLGAYIAYDAISYLWPTMSNLHAGQPRDGALPEVPEIRTLERAARAVVAAPIDESALESYRSAQFELWRAMRRQGNPWLVTDFISVGTPMYFADLLFTKKRKFFKELVHRTELARCPPVRGTQTVESGTLLPPGYYSFVNRGRRVLVHGAPFAVVRWTNLFFPVRRLFFGDWFGGPLRPLFGPGILDVSINGGKGSNWPALAHSQYFAHADEPHGDKPNKHEQQPAVRELRRHLRLNLSAADLADSFDAPDADPTTDLTHR